MVYYCRSHRHSWLVIEDRYEHAFTESELLEILTDDFVSRYEYAKDL